jgi:drug/metabolite transporter (DMT)-like permease
MRPRAWAAFAAVSVIWGVPYFLIKIAVAEVSPLFLAWVRFAIAAAILIPLAWRSGALRGLRARWRAVLAFALVETTGPFVLIPVGERWLSSSLAAILIAAVPLTVALLAIRFAPEERPTGVRLAGLLVGLAGVIALLGIDVAGRPLELLGAACLLGATLGYAGGPLIVKAKLGDLHPLGPVAASLAINTVVLLPPALVTWPARLPSAATVMALLALGVVCTAAGLALFFYLVTEAGPSRATVITYVNPAVAVALGVLVLGERIGAVSVAGLLLILAGSWLSTGGRLPPGLGAALVRPLRRRGRQAPAAGG